MIAIKIDIRKMITKKNYIRKLIKSSKLFFFSQEEKQSPISDEYIRKVLKKVEQNKYEEWQKEMPKEKENEIKIQPQAKKHQTIILHHGIEFVGPKTDGIIQTNYGNLKIPEYYLKKMNGKVTNIYYLENDTKVNFVRKIFKEDKTALFLFEPHANYSCIRNLIESFSSRIADFYFPKSKLRSDMDLSNDSHDRAINVYHKTIRKLIDMRCFLNRVCVVLNHDMTLRNDESPDLQNSLGRYMEVSEILTSQALAKESFFKYDMIVPVTLITKAHSVKNMEELGISLDYLYDVYDSDITANKKELFNPKIFKKPHNLTPDQTFKDDFMEGTETIKNNHENIISQNRIFPMIGTFPPTNRVLLKFLFNKLTDKKNILKLKENILDIGIGSGILPIIFRKSVQSKKQAYFGIDKSPTAIECAKRNCLLYNIELKTSLIDVTKLKYNQDEDLSIGEDFPKTFDFIICNPPWIIAKPIEHFDTGNYDYKEEFLTTVFKLVSKLLDKSNGVFWLVYSDLSALLGLQTQNRIYQLCEENGLIIKAESICKADLVEKTIKTEIDVVKKKSKYLVFEITH